MAEKESKSTDNAEALGLYKREKFDSSTGGAQGNDKGNQRPVNTPTAIKGSKSKFK